MQSKILSFVLSPQHVIFLFSVGLRLFLRFYGTESISLLSLRTYYMIPCSAVLLFYTKII